MCLVEITEARDDIEDGKAVPKQNGGKSRAFDLAEHGITDASGPEKVALRGAQGKSGRAAEQNVLHTGIARQSAGSSESADEDFGVVKVRIFESRTSEPKGTSRGRGKSHIIVVAQKPREKARHEGPGLEANSDPVAVGGTLHGSGRGFGSTEREKSLAGQVGNGEFEAGCGDRKEIVRAVVVATPDLFHERMIGRPVFKVDEADL